jgi:hypothetical protein
MHGTYSWKEQFKMDKTDHGRFHGPGRSETGLNNLHKRNTRMRYSVDPMNILILLMIILMIS